MIDTKIQKSAINLPASLAPPDKFWANRPITYLKPDFSAKMPAFLLADICG